jgi:NADH:ubiquinone oxidoreductase subunit 5 (subunit L)/multisubunit Na+/H+ antiporter MnhA subunit
MTLGNFAAFFQTSVQRLLAYSTISQAGYLLMAVAVATRSGLALRSLLFSLAAYAATNLAAFAVVAELPNARTIGAYRGLAVRHPALAAVLVVSLLGLVGTPPTGVFFGKLQVFTATIDGGYAWLAALAVVNTVASLFYYLRWLAPAFLQRPPETSTPRTPSSPPAGGPPQPPTPQARPRWGSASQAPPSSRSSPATSPGSQRPHRTSAGVGSAGGLAPSKPILTTTTPVQASRRARKAAGPRHSGVMSA